MLHTSFEQRFTPSIPLDFIDPDPMLDLAALEEESSAINDLNHYSCTSYEY